MGKQRAMWGEKMRRAAAQLVRVLAFVTALAGCAAPLATTGSGDGRVVLPTHAHDEGEGFLAGAGGTLRKHGDCVVLRYVGVGQKAAQLRPLLWPKGFTAAFNPLRVYNAAGDEVAREGEQFRASGAVVPGTAADHCDGMDTPFSITEVVQPGDRP